MKFICEIDCSNDAMRHDDGQVDVEELSRLANAAVDGVGDCHTSGRLMDANGNTVGEWSIHERDDEDMIRVEQLRSIMTDDELESMQDAIDRMQGEEAD